jgi:adenine-specific DNA-methyltransferase
MTKVFIGGSRRISRLSADVKQRIDRIIAKRLPVLVGDANGADKAVQEYLRSKNYDLVEVFCSGESCRNNTGHWQVRTIPVNGTRKDFSFYATKDRAMADEASIGLMLWDRESVGTLMNVLRLIRHHKKVVLFIAPNDEFVDLKNDEDWTRLVAGCAAGLRDRIEREASAELPPHESERTPAQASLF